MGLCPCLKVAHHKICVEVGIVIGDIANIIGMREGEGKCCRTATLLHKFTSGGLQNK